MNNDTEPQIEKQTKDPEEIKQFLEVLKSMAERILVPYEKITNMDFDHDGKIDGFSFQMANPFYTAESIASINNIELSIDGKTIDPQNISLLVREQRIRLQDAKTMHELWWGFGELISIYVEKDNGLESGTYSVNCKLRMRTTITYGFPGGLLFPVKKIMTVN